MMDAAHPDRPDVTETATATANDAAPFARRDTVAVAIAAGPDSGAVVAAAIETAGGLTCDACLLDEAVVVLGATAPATTETARAVAAVARRRAARVRVVPPPGGLGLARATRRKLGRAGWITVDISARATHLAEVLIPVELSPVSGLVGVASIVGETRPRPPLAIGLWTPHAHPKQALAARLLREPAFAAEIALAFGPRLYVVSARLGSLPLVVATSDAIAAELVGLALHQEALDPNRELDLDAPWMDPLVQRATELRLGVATPDQLALIPVWTGPAGGEAALRELADRVRLTLGIPDHPPRSTAG